MKILITGATGLIGQALLKALRNREQSNQHRICVLTRNKLKACDVLGHDIDAMESLPSLADIDVIINLAGEPIAAKRWTAKQKERIKQSRWQLTEQLVTRIQHSDSPPGLFISGSAIGYYGRQPAQQRLTEDTHQVHPEFQHEVCATWENIANQATSEYTRVCLLRTGIVLSPEGGALPRMALPIKLGFGGPVGDGQQMQSWIHLDDMVRAILHLLDDSTASGPYNMTAPEPVSNAEFSQTLADVLHRPCLLRMPAPVLRGLLGEMADLLLTGQAVLPQRLLNSGFHFHHPELKDALLQCYPPRH